MEFLSNLNVKPPYTNAKPPYLRLSGDGSERHKLVFKVCSKTLKNHDSFLKYLCLTNHTSLSSSIFSAKTRERMKHTKLWPRTFLRCCWRASTNFTAPSLVIAQWEKFKWLMLWNALPKTDTTLSPVLRPDKSNNSNCKGKRVDVCKYTCSYNWSKAWLHGC